VGGHPTNQIRNASLHKLHRVPSFFSSTGFLSSSAGFRIPFCLPYFLSFDLSVRLFLTILLSANLLAVIMASVIAFERSYPGPRADLFRGNTDFDLREQLDAFGRPEYFAVFD
jgi:hypothetical protein